MFHFLKFTTYGRQLDVPERQRVVVSPMVLAVSFLLKFE